MKTINMGQKMDQAAEGGWSSDVTVDVRPPGGARLCREDANGTDAVSHQFQQVKRQLLTDALRETRDETLRRYVRLACNEAAALAWLTCCPLLVFAELFTEKVVETHRRYLRQQVLRMAVPWVMPAHARPVMREDHRLFATAELAPAPAVAPRNLDGACALAIEHAA